VLDKSNGRAGANPSARRLSARASYSLRGRYSNRYAPCPSPETSRVFHSNWYTWFAVGYSTVAGYGYDGIALNGSGVTVCAKAPQKSMSFTKPSRYTS